MINHSPDLGVSWVKLASFPSVVVDKVGGSSSTLIDFEVSINKQWDCMLRVQLKYLLRKLKYIGSLALSGGNRTDSFTKSSKVEFSFLTIAAIKTRKV